MNNIVSAHVMGSRLVICIGPTKQGELSRRRRAEEVSPPTCRERTATSAGNVDQVFTNVTGFDAATSNLCKCHLIRRCDLESSQKTLDSLDAADVSLKLQSDVSLQMLPPPLHMNASSSPIPHEYLLIPNLAI